MTFEQQRSAGYLLNRSARLMAQLLADRLRPLGVAPAQFSVMVELDRHDGQTQRALVDALDVEQGTLTNTLQRMVRDGLLRRTRHEHDARASRWWLTPRARALLAPATAAAAAVNDEVLAALTPAAREALLRSLAAVIERVRVATH